MSQFKELAFGDLRTEHEHTLRVLRAIPDEKFDWSPHERSWNIGGVANHLANIPSWQTMIVKTNELDLAGMGSQPDPAPEMGPIIEAFQRNRAEFEEALAAVSEEDLAEEWVLRMGEHVLMSGSRSVMLRELGVNHSAHHRGQLTVYLRLLDIPVPATYGPSADDPGNFG